MPPRQPLKLKTSTRRSTRKPMPLSEALPQISADLAAASPKPAPKRTGFSPYPDLTMAIEMLEKRAVTLTDGERKTLILKWKESLSKLNEEMQKLHKLEILANRLITPKS
ncbi:MAG: hypothetical protein EON60_00525 [Alphaproteobacteria bacterium]|nr:MAG: hypothetical protein EON60_03495 [Alphaproteobacteria bacterium]RYG62239.1 MAG: hypothetical protein EON60_00525 [Alphaproteobacteria bacterium]